ncbi:MAG: hypothetical protein KDK64_07265 [Chlamydiia bacterium]|nr:hypothetical protein [Chlamydiia bacterium]
MKHFIDFYLGKAPNQEGVTIEEILAYSDEELERHHNFIQWLFPLTTPSSVNPHVPLVTPKIIAAFKENRALQDQLLRATKVMLHFYGLTFSKDQVLKDKTFQEKKHRIAGHNLLRITRILKSLVLLGQPELSLCLFICLCNIAQDEMPELQSTIDQHWRNASHY